MFPFDFDILEFPAPKKVRREPFMMSIIPAVAVNKQQTPKPEMAAKKDESLLEPFAKFPNLRHSIFAGNRLQKLDSEDPKQWGFTLDVDSGYKPDDIKVKQEGQKLVIKGSLEHKSPDGTQIESRSFQRTLAIPENVKLDTLKVEMHENGQLTVRGDKEVPEIQKTKTREIPIEIVQRSEECEKKNKESKDQEKEIVDLES